MNPSYNNGYSNVTPSYAVPANPGNFSPPVTSGFPPTDQAYSDVPPTNANQDNTIFAVPAEGDAQSVLRPAIEDPRMMDPSGEAAPPSVETDPLNVETDPPKGELVPGMVLPDGSIVISVGDPE